MQDTIASIALSTREVSNAAAEISTSTTDLSQRTEEQAASLEETSASMEQISATVKKNAENAQQANELTQRHAAKSPTAAARWSRRRCQRDGADRGILAQDLRHHLR